MYFWDAHAEINVVHATWASAKEEIVKWNWSTKLKVTPPDPDPQAADQTHAAAAAACKQNDKIIFLVIEWHDLIWLTWPVQASTYTRKLVHFYALCLHNQIAAGYVQIVAVIEQAALCQSMSCITLHVWSCVNSSRAQASFLWGHFPDSVILRTQMFVLAYLLCLEG